MNAGEEGDDSDKIIAVDRGGEESGGDGDPHDGEYLDNMVLIYVDTSETSKREQRLITCSLVVAGSRVVAVGASCSGILLDRSFLVRKIVERGRENS